MVTFFIDLVADQSLGDTIKLIGGVLIALLASIVSVLVSILDLCAFLEYLLMNQSSRERVPETRNVEPVDGSK